MFRFGNQSQSTVGIIREAGSVRSSTATSSSTRSSKSNIPYFEDEDESPDDILLEDRAREARVLESKVARVASRSFSVAEITALQKEVDRWLTKVTAADASPALLSPALFLSSLLLKIILANHLVFSDASEVSKNTEMSLKAKVEELELEKRRLELELREQKIQYSQKDQGNLSLRIEPSHFVTTPSVPNMLRSPSPRTPLPAPPGLRVAPPRTPSPTDFPPLPPGLRVAPSRIPSPPGFRVAPPRIPSPPGFRVAPPRTPSPADFPLPPPGLHVAPPRIPSSPGFRVAPPRTPSPTDFPPPPPGLRVAPPTSFRSNIASRLRFTRSASVVPTPPR